MLVEFQGTARLDKRTKRLFTSPRPRGNPTPTPPHPPPAAGRELTTQVLERNLEEQQGRLAEALEGFAENTMRFLRQDGTLVAEDLRLPQLRTRFRDRPAPVVPAG